MLGCLFEWVCTPNVDNRNVTRFVGEIPQSSNRKIQTKIF